MRKMNILIKHMENPIGDACFTCYSIFAFFCGAIAVGSLFIFPFALAPCCDVRSFEVDGCFFCWSYKNGQSQKVRIELSLK
jgi:hypothetical protein